MYNLTFIIPCGRIPFANAGQKTVDSILKNHPDAEIIVSSKEKIHYKDIISIQERSDNIGCVKPCNIMALMARGDYICMLNDDYYLNDNSINPAIDYLLKHHLMGLTLFPCDGIGTGVGRCPFYDNKKGSWLDTVMFPVVKKEFIASYGELMFFRLKHYYGDNTISIRLWKDFNQTKFVFDNNSLYVCSSQHTKYSLFKEQPNEFETYKKFLRFYNVTE